MRRSGRRTAVTYLGVEGRVVQWWMGGVIVVEVYFFFPFKYNYILIKYARNAFLPGNYWRQEAEIAFHTSNHN